MVKSSNGTSRMCAAVLVTCGMRDLITLDRKIVTKWLAAKSCCEGKYVCRNFQILDRLSRFLREACVYGHYICANEVQHSLLIVSLIQVTRDRPCE